MSSGSSYIFLDCVRDLVEDLRNAKKKVEYADMQIEDANFDIKQIGSNVNNNPDASWFLHLENKLTCNGKLDTANEKIDRANKNKKNALHEITKIEFILANLKTDGILDKEILKTFYK
ncbi:MAG: hypothetical protein Homavirus20_7 [Homavirus sp.]|uniref:Uncharacterized protein n=1 Tax=Homavirus sp. TaxID=2487769 RepID=A0A3G5AA77_9VIRU|nr:MAG: hypothetical protein Homavirus20_7 [Homavirus sp.]